MSSEILVADEVADLLRVDRQRVYELARRKLIPVICIGERQYRFSKIAIENWLEQGGNQTSVKQTESVLESKV